MTHNGLENVLELLVSYANLSMPLIDRLLDKKYKLIQENGAYYICNKDIKYLEIKIKNSTIITSKLKNTKSISEINDLFLEYARKCKLEAIEI